MQKKKTLGLLTSALKSVYACNPALGRREQKNEELKSQQGLYKTLSQKLNNNNK